MQTKVLSKIVCGMKFNYRKFKGIIPIYSVCGKTISYNKIDLCENCFRKSGDEWNGWEEKEMYKLYEIRIRDFNT